MVNIQPSRTNSNEVAVGNRAVAIGVDTRTDNAGSGQSEDNVAIGTRASTVVNNSFSGQGGMIAIGLDSSVTDRDSLAIGKEATVSDNGSIAIGWLSEAASSRAVKIGRGRVDVGGGIAIGAFSSAESANGAGSFSVAIGRSATATEANQGVLGNVGNTENWTVPGNLKIGNTDTAGSSALLELESTTKGLLFPRMTTTERDNISTPAEGLVIYNTTNSALEFYNGTSWAAI